MKTKTTCIKIYILLLALTPVFVINAEDDEMPIPAFITASSTRGVPVRKEIREVRREGREEIRDIRKEGREEVRNARTSTTSTTTIREFRKEVRADVKKEVEARRSEIKTQVDVIKAANKEARSKKLDERAKSRVEASLDIIYKRLDEKLNKLTKIDIEVARRLATLSSASSTVSVDTIASLKTSYTASQVLFTKAKIDVSLTKTTVVGELTATTSKEVVRGLVTQAEVSIKAAAESYKKLAEALKAAKLKTKGDTTVSTTTN